MSNHGATLDDVLQFLSSGEVVITNSYHGAYRATLLGRAAVIVTQNSSKFYHMKHVHPYAKWEDAMKAERHWYPNALEECRAANMAFHAKVKDIAGKMTE